MGRNKYLQQTQYCDKQRDKLTGKQMNHALPTAVFSTNMLQGLFEVNKLVLFFMTVGSTSKLKTCV